MPMWTWRPKISSRRAGYWSCSTSSTIARRAASRAVPRRARTDACRRRRRARRRRRPGARRARGASRSSRAASGTSAQTGVCTSISDWKSSHETLPGALAALGRLENGLHAVDEVEAHRVEEHVLLLDAERVRRGAAEPVLADARSQLVPPPRGPFESVAPAGRAASGERPRARCGFPVAQDAASCSRRRSHAAPARAENLSDDVGLRVGVVLHVLPFAARELALRALVELAVAGVAAQVVAEAEHALDLDAAGREDVQVHARARVLRAGGARTSPARGCAGRSPRLRAPARTRPRRPSRRRRGRCRRSASPRGRGSTWSPACSIWSAASPSASRIRVSSRSKRRGHSGS